MSKPKKNTKPLDMTSDEAVKFLFPKKAIDEMRKVANPDNQKVSEPDKDSDESSYDQDNR